MSGAPDYYARTERVNSCRRLWDMYAPVITVRGFGRKELLTPTYTGMEFLGLLD